MGKLSQNVLKMDKNFAPNCFLYVIINASKTQILVPQVNKKFGPSERLHLSPGRIVNIQREELQPWRCHGSISIPVYRAKPT